MLKNLRLFFHTSVRKTDLIFLEKRKPYTKIVNYKILKIVKKTQDRGSEFKAGPKESNCINVYNLYVFKMNLLYKLSSGTE